MSAPSSCLIELPTEILEKMFLHLPGQDIVKMEAVRSAAAIISDDSVLTLPCAAEVSRQFQDLTRNSPILRHKRNLFSAGLVEAPCNSRDFSQRRRLYEEHERKWSMRGKQQRPLMS